MVNVTAKTEKKPFMMSFKESFKVPRVGGSYNKDIQVREVKDENGKTIIFIKSGEMLTMGSTRTGERTSEH